jgi:DNA-binding winged helix-turn-helix (wHTH) protein
VDNTRRLGVIWNSWETPGSFEKHVRIRFGDCTLDTDSRELLRDGRPVHVTGKAFQMLQMLVENAPKALSKDALQNSLWPDVFVDESNLASLVTELRSAIGDDARNPRFIRTVYGFGYAFSGELTETGRVPPAARPAGVSRYRLFWGHKEIVLAEGENILGRGPESLHWIDHDTVSRRHARVVVAGENATLEDLGSKNGTYLHGRPVEHPTVLEDGDDIRLGSVPLKLKVLAEPGSTATKSRARK